MMKKYLMCALCALSITTYASTADTTCSRWLDSYPQHVGLSWKAGTSLMANYLWRGGYSGGLALQPDFSIGYGGAFIDMWWNAGATDWTFTKLKPEVDFILGFSRWGLTVAYIQMYYFDRYTDGTMSRFFDYSNHGPGEGGITSEWRIQYKVSSKLPLSIFWGTRTFGRDGYYVENADGTKTLKRAYSSYLELGYDFALPHHLTLETRLGMTPWKSLYTKFQGDFAVVNFSNKLIWKRELAKHLDMTAFAQIMLNPYDMALMTATGDRTQSRNNGRPILWNVGCGFWLK